MCRQYKLIKHFTARRVEVEQHSSYSEDLFGTLLFRQKCPSSQDPWALLREAGAALRVTISCFLFPMAGKCLHSHRESCVSFSSSRGGWAIRESWMARGGTGCSAFSAWFGRVFSQDPSNEIMNLTCPAVCAFPQRTRSKANPLGTLSTGNHELAWKLHWTLSNALGLAPGACTVLLVCSGCCCCSALKEEGGLCVSGIVSAPPKACMLHHAPWINKAR